MSVKLNQQLTTQIADLVKLKLEIQNQLLKQKQGNGAKSTFTLYSWYQTHFA